MWVINVYHNLLSIRHQEPPVGSRLAH